MKEYICQLCLKDFQGDGEKYWHHTHRKTLCIPKDQVLNQLIQQTGKEKLFEDKTKRLEEENNRLKKQIELYEELKKEKQEKQQIINNNFDFSSNNLTIQNLSTNDTTDFSKYFNVELVQDKKQTLDHISTELYLEILKSKSVDQSITQLIKTIYFNPKAPENYSWCVVDKKTKIGTFSYSHELNILTPVDTIDTIEKKVQHIIPRVMETMTDIHNRVPFTTKQEQNYHGLFGMYGTPLTTTTMNEIKNMAYENRDLPRATWKQLCLKMIQ